MVSAGLCEPQALTLGGTLQEVSKGQPEIEVLLMPLTIHSVPL